MRRLANKEMGASSGWSLSRIDRRRREALLASLDVSSTKEHYSAAVDSIKYVEATVQFILKAGPFCLHDI